MYCYDSGWYHGTKWCAQKPKLNGSIIDLESRSTATTAAVQKKFAVSSLVLHGQQWLRVRQEVVRGSIIPPPPPPPPPLRWSTNLLDTKSLWVGFTSAEHLAHNFAGEWLRAGSGDSQLLVAHWAKRQCQRPWMGQMDSTQARSIPRACFCNRDRPRTHVADLSVTKQHQNDR